MSASVVALMKVSSGSLLSSSAVVTESYILPRLVLSDVGPCCWSVDRRMV